MNGHVGAKFHYDPPAAPSRCTWKLGADPATSPHTKDVRKVKPKILADISEAVGDTPMVRVNKLAKEYGIKCQLLAKCEFLNPGGSLKDRIVPRMIDDAERAGLINKDTVLIAPSSGNTGIGVALMAAVRGYRCIIVMPQKMSKEKEDTIKALGAEIIRTPNVGYESLESSFAVAQKLQTEIPNSYVLDQYRSASNPLAHYDITAEEILEQCDGDLDMLVMGTGTGGAITGLARKLKEKCPKCQIVAVDPVGSTMAGMGKKGFFEVEGIGHDFVPTVCDSKVVDRWYQVTDKDTMQMARRLIKTEGFLVGGSSGSNMVAALDLAKELGEHQKCVVLLPDGVRNYMTKFLSDQWMLERGFIDTPPSVQKQWWADIPAEKLINGIPRVLKESIETFQAIEAFKEAGVSSLPVVNEQNCLTGMVSLDKILSKLMEGELDATTTVHYVKDSSVKHVHPEDPLSRIAYMLHGNDFVAVTGEKDQLEGLIYKTDFLEFIAKRNPQPEAGIIHNGRDSL